eukprot:1915493-Lingulodinium_polyedra.AAC.1
MQTQTKLDCAARLRVWGGGQVGQAGRNQLRFGRNVEGVRGHRGHVQPGVDVRPRGHVPGGAGGAVPRRLPEHRPEGQEGSVRRVLC